MEHPVEMSLIKEEMQNFEEDLPENTDEDPLFADPFLEKISSKKRPLTTKEINETLKLLEEFHDSDSYGSESDYENDVLEGLGWADESGDEELNDPTYRQQETDSSSDDSDAYQAEIIDAEEDILRGRGSVRRRRRQRGRVGSSSSRSSSGGRGGGRGVRTHGSAAATEDDGWTDGRNFVPHDYVFGGSAGVTLDFDLDSNMSEESDYFRKFIDDDIVQVMADETNRYHSLLTRDRPPGTSKMKKWVDVCLQEMIVFLALTLLMPHTSKHRMRDYWATDAYIYTPIYGNFMPRDRYQDIYRFLHFTDNEMRDRNSNDRLWKIRDVLEMVRERFKKYFYPFQKLVVDESLVLFKGRLIFKRYIRTKRHRFGIKIYVICDCKTGYVLDIVIYTGTDVDIPANDPLGHSGAVVKTLMDPYWNAGHILYTDNYYTSPGLSTYLHDNNTGLVGTVRDSRKGMPKFPKGIKRGEAVFRKKAHHLLVKWKDRKEFNLLSGIHTGQMISTGKQDYRTRETIYKPDVIVDYMKNMRLVDKSDMQIGYVSCTRRTMKWYKKALFHIIDVCMLNAYNLYKFHTKQSISLRYFSLNVCKQLLTKYGQFQRTAKGKFVEQPETSRLAPRQWCQTHFLDRLPETQKGKLSQRTCHVCANTKNIEERRRKLVTTWCPTCGVGLCLPCFKIYHSYNEF